MHHIQVFPQLVRRHRQRRTDADDLSRERPQKVNGSSLLIAQATLPVSEIPARVRIAFVLLLLLVFFVYSNTFNASWHMDDYPNITSNSKLHINIISNDG